MNGRMAKKLRKERLQQMNNHPQTQPQNPVQNIVQAVLKDPQDYVNVICPACGNSLFDRATIIKVIPATHPMNPTGRPQNLNLETFVCRSCGYFLDARMGASQGMDEANA